MSIQQKNVTAHSHCRGRPGGGWGWSWQCKHWAIASCVYTAAAAVTAVHAVHWVLDSFYNFHAFLHMYMNACHFPPSDAFPNPLQSGFYRTSCPTTAHIYTCTHTRARACLRCIPPRPMLLCSYSAGRFDLSSAVGPLRLDLGDVLYAPNLLRDDGGRLLLFGWLQERRTVRCRCSACVVLVHCTALCYFVYNTCQVAQLAVCL